MCDEVGLLAAAQQHPVALAGIVPAQATLTQLRHDVGIELATAIYYQAILATLEHGALIRAVDSLPAAPLPAPSTLRLLIVPALYYQELPQYGGDGDTIGQIARACGLAVTVAPLLSKGSLGDNANLLWETLCSMADAAENIPEGTVILLSLSVGGGEVRRMLAQHAGDARLKKLGGWINVCGLVRGLPLVTQLLRHPLRRLHAVTVCKVIGLDFDLVRELDPAHPWWQGPINLPPYFATQQRVINLFGVPLHSHVQQRSLFKRYGWMQEVGPNDGMALLPDLLVEPGLIYPLWGADHYFRTPQVSPLFYRLFRYIRQTWAGEDFEQVTPLQEAPLQEVLA